MRFPRDTRRGAHLRVDGRVGCVLVTPQWRGERAMSSTKRPICHRQLCRCARHQGARKAGDSWPSRSQARGGGFGPPCWLLQIGGSGCGGGRKHSRRCLINRAGSGAPAAEKLLALAGRGPKLHLPCLRHSFRPPTTCIVPMHIPDGFVDVKTAVVASAFAAAGLGCALYQVRRELPPRRVPLLGLDRKSVV
jgi:hypothetical protein